MRDVFAILAIILAVLSLGIFRVPEENAMVTAGIRAEAEALVAQAQHPLDIAVDNTSVTVTGRVESAEDAKFVLDGLAKIDSVSDVQGDLQILPSVSPFSLTITKTDHGVTYGGNLVSLGQADELGGLFGVAPDLTVATGRPDAEWRGVALRAAEILAQMQSGEMDLTDYDLTLSGIVHLPRQKTDLESRLVDLPEGYIANLSIRALDDGQPYRLRLTRDDLMGLRVSGKLPPDWDDSALDVLGPVMARDIRNAPQPLYAPGFDAAVDLFLPIMADPDFIGDIVIATGLVTVSAGPLEAAKIADIQSRADQLPPNIGADLVLVPTDSGAGLSITLTREGANVTATGRVPSDFDLAALGEHIGLPVTDNLDRSPYPDLTNWQSGFWDASRALGELDSGSLTYGVEGVIVSGAANAPAQRADALTYLGEAQTEIHLIDDGSPPAFSLTFDAASGASLDGKLPNGLTETDLADALGVDGIRARVRVSNLGNGARIKRNAIAALSALAPHMAMIETADLTLSDGTLTLTAAALTGIDADILRQRIGHVPASVPFTLTVAPAPPSSTRRVHAATGQAQVFSRGIWMPVLDVDLTPDSCNMAGEQVPAIPFAPRSFALDFDATLPLNHLTALVRACVGLGAMRLDIEGVATTAAAEVLNSQLGRRRADAIRRALIERGVSGDLIRAKAGQAGSEETVTYRFSDG